MQNIKITKHEHADELLTRADLNAAKYKDDPALKRISSIFKRDFINRVRFRHQASPLDSDIYYDSYICAFSNEDDKGFQCVRLTVGDQIYDSNSDILRNMQSLDDLLAMTYSMYDEAKAKLSLLLDLFYNEYEPSFIADANIENVTFPDDGLNPEHIVTRISFHFVYRAKNR